MSPWKGDVFAIAKTLRAGAKVSQDNQQAVQLFRRAVREKLTGPRSGMLYTTLFFTSKEGNVVPYGERPPHQASAPGEPPAEDTGELLRGMKVDARRMPYGALVTITSTAPYSAYLEFGTSKMEPRPYMRPLGQENKVHVRRIYRDGIIDRERAMARALGGKG